MPETDDRALTDEKNSMSDGEDMRSVVEGAGEAT